MSAGEIADTQAVVNMSVPPLERVRAANGTDDQLDGFCTGPQSNMSRG
jgi:hypothetical protein